MNSDIWIIITAVMVATTCSILGTFLLLRNMTMVGDAISHAVLPGIVISFIITGSRDSIPMLLGAGLLGVLATVLIELMHIKLKIQEDAAIGVAFTFLFSVGVILIAKFADQVDLDQDCVLYGDLSMIPFDTIILNGFEWGPRVTYISAINLIAIIALVVFAYKELLITSFDGHYAAFLGLNATLWHYVLMGAVSFTTVSSFESVGAILVVALLVVPPATAYMISKSLKPMLWLSILFGATSAIGGYGFSYLLDSSIAGCIATIAGIQLVVVLLVSKTLKKKALAEPVNG